MLLDREGGGRWKEGKSFSLGGYMKSIMRILIGMMLIASAALETGRPQSASRQLRLSDIKAQQPQETIAASAACQGFSPASDR
jgi:hypothetical protein